MDGANINNIRAQVWLHCAGMPGLDFGNSTALAV